MCNPAHDGKMSLTIYVKGVMARQHCDIIFQFKTIILVVRINI